MSWIKNATTAWALPSWMKPRISSTVKPMMSQPRISLARIFGSGLFRPGARNSATLIEKSLRPGAIIMMKNAQSKPRRLVDGPDGTTGGWDDPRRGAAEDRVRGQRANPDPLPELPDRRQRPGRIDEPTGQLQALRARLPGHPDRRWCRSRTETPVGHCLDRDAAEAPPALQASDPAAKQPSRQRVEALELEIRRLREDLSTEQAAIGELDKLREQLTQALDARKKAEAREQALRKEIEELREQAEQTIQVSANEGKSSLREEELRFLRDQLDKARAEAESEARKRRETASILASRTAEAAEALAARNDAHAKALKAKEDEHARALKTKEDEHAKALATKESHHAQALRAKSDDHAQAARREVEKDRARPDAGREGGRARPVPPGAPRAARTSPGRRPGRRGPPPGRRRRQDRGREPPRRRGQRPPRGTRPGPGRTRRRPAQTSTKSLRRDREQAEAGLARQVEERDGRLADDEARLADADATRADRDRLAGELEGLRARALSTSRAAGRRAQGDGAPRGSARDRDQIEAARAAEAEIADLRDQLERARGDVAAIETAHRERDEARIQRDRFAEELDALQARLAEADQRVNDWGYDSTEMDVPQAAPSSEISAYQPEGSTVYDGGIQGLRAELRPRPGRGRDVSGSRPSRSGPS